MMGVAVCRHQADSRLFQTHSDKTQIRVEKAAAGGVQAWFHHRSENKGSPRALSGKLKEKEKEKGNNQPSVPGVKAGSLGPGAIYHRSLVGHNPGLGRQAAGMELGGG